jgi:nucleotide-binding universal stress UspA family protein
MYRDASRARYTKLWGPRVEKAVSASNRNGVVLVIDNSANAMKASRYVAEHFAMDPEMKVTIMGFIREPSEDLFGHPDEYRRAKKDNEENIAALVDAAQKTLLSGGFLKESISVKTVRIRKETVASRLLEEQKRNPCDTIVVGGVKLSKPEEFIFGNLAVKLVRESECPVVTVY